MTAPTAASTSIRWRSACEWARRSAVRSRWASLSLANWARSASRRALPSVVAASTPSL